MANQQQQQGNRVQQQQQPAGEHVTTAPAENVNLAPKPTAYVRFERVTGANAKLPYARCSYILDGSLNGLELDGFCVWRNDKGVFSLTLPGLRFPLIKATSVIAKTIDGDETTAISPKGVKKLTILEEQVFAAFSVWANRPEAFPGGLVPVTL